MKAKLWLSDNTIFNAVGIRSGGNVSNIGMTIAMLRLSGYAIFKGVGFG